MKYDVSARSIASEHGKAASSAAESGMRNLKTDEDGDSERVRPTISRPRYGNGARS